MAWLYLLLAGIFEVGFTTCLRMVEGFRNPPRTAGFVLCVGLSMFFLDKATRGGIPLGTGYAVWTGIGAAGTVLVGALAFAEPATPLRIALIFALVACVAGLKLTSGH